MAARVRRALWSWEGLLLAILAVVVAINASVPGYLTLQNQVNLFVLNGEKVLVVLVMAFIIISGEIDLSVASILGMSSALLGASLIDLLQQSLIRWLAVSEFLRDALLSLLILLAVASDAVVLERVRARRARQHRDRMVASDPAVEASAHGG